VARSNEALWWSLFSAGGVASALFLPAMILLTGIAMPLGWLGEDAFAYERMRRLASHPAGALFLFVLISLSLFHAAHRLHAALSEPWLKPIRPLLNLALYGGSAAGTLAAAAILWRL